MRGIPNRFDAVVLLSALIDVLFHRLNERTNNPFGKTEEERQRIAGDIAEIEPLLREAASHEIDTTCPVSEVVDTLVDIASRVAPTS